MIIMDYDNWLQKGAGCFYNYLEADDDKIFEYYTNSARKMQPFRLAVVHE